MKNTLNQVFHSGKFVLVFIFTMIYLVIIFRFLPRPEMSRLRVRSFHLGPRECVNTSGCPVTWMSRGKRIAKRLTPLTALP
jgi:hypothetical protein